MLVSAAAARVLTRPRVPVVLAAVMIERFVPLLMRYRSGLVWTSRASGALLVVVGVLMVTGSMTTMTAWLQRLTPDFLRQRL